MTLIGIDNGAASGGIAALSDRGRSSPFGMNKLPARIHVRKGNPDSKDKQARLDKNFTELDAVAFTEMILAIDRPDKILAVLEDCPDHADRASTMRSMAHCAGSILSCLALLNIRVVRVMPHTWQGYMIGQTIKGGTKAAAYQLARKFWPDEKFILKGCREPNTAIVDAALIAEYARLLKL